MRWFNPAAATEDEDLDAPRGGLYGVISACRDVPEWSGEPHHLKLSSSLLREEYSEGPQVYRAFSACHI
jgi:hypothetical protein